MTLPANADMPANAGPGQYIQIRSRGQNPTIQADRAFTGRQRVNIVAAVTSDGELYTTPDAPRLISGLADAVTKAGKRSPARAMIEYCYARRPAGVEVYLTPIVMSTGVAASFNVYWALIGAATAAVGSGQAAVLVNDYPVFVDIADGDTPAVLAGKLKAAYDKAVAPAIGTGKGVPYTAGAVVGGAVPYTAGAAGLWGNSHPVAVYFPSTVSGIGLSPGFLTFGAGPSGAAAGTLTLRCHHKSAQVTGIAMGTTAILTATAVVTQINAITDFPLRLVQRPAPGNDVVDLYYKNGRPAHDIQVTINAALGPVTVTYTGETLGTGAPSLSNALTALQNADAMQEWATCFTDATSIGALVQHIRSEGNGYDQKEQFLTWASTLGTSSAGALVTSITPSIVFEDEAQSSPGRNAQLVCPGAFQPEYALAAMVAMDRAFEPRPTKNFDGRQLVTNLPGIPLSYPDAADGMGNDTANEARATYFMTPLIVRNNNFLIQQFVSTYGGTLLNWASVSYVRGMANIRQEIRAALSVYAGKEMVLWSPALTDDVFTPSAAEQTMYSRCKTLEQSNLYDGADKFRGLFKAEPVLNSPGDVRVYVPGSPPIENHRISGQLGPVSV